MRHTENPIRIAVTGGPGAGKTSMLEGLRQRGCTIVPEVAREIIGERKALGLSPRPSPIEFATAIFNRDIERYESAGTLQGMVFYDRCLLDSLGMLAELDQLTEAETRKLIEQYRYHSTAFILPPWREIYHTDSERDQTYEDAARVYEALKEWYVKCGYALIEIPTGTIEERCEFVLRKLWEWRVGG